MATQNAINLSQSGVIYYNGTGTFSGITQTDGQLIIGRTGNSPVAATLTAGTGIAITNGVGTITISNSGAGFNWTEVTGTSQTLAVENGYVVNNAGLVTLTLPTSAAIGDSIQVVGKGAGLWTIVYGASQQIKFGNQSTTLTSGSLTATNANDCVELVCTTASGSAPIFTVVDGVGNLTIA